VRTQGEAQWLHDSLTINNIIVSGEAILSAENSGNLLESLGSAPNPAEGDLFIYLFITRFILHVAR